MNNDKATLFLHRVNSFLMSSRLLLHPNNPNHHHPITAVFLNSICLELIIKIFWMIEKDKECPYTHKTYLLFTELKDETKKYIESSFYNNEDRKEIFKNLRNEIKKKTNDELPEEDFIEILKCCEDIVKNIKYNQSGFKHVLGGQHLDFLDSLKNKLKKRLLIEL